MSQPSSGIVQCPSCGQKALPMQTRCLNCNARLRESKSDAPTDEYVIPFQADAPAPPTVADGKCPGCGKEMAAAAVLCIDCGYDLRTGRKRETVHAVAAEEPEPESPRRKRKRGREPLPAGFAVVRLGLGCHYARLVLTLLSLLALMGLLAYGAAVKPKADDWGVLAGGLVAAGIVLLAALLGVVGSALCLWVRGDRVAWWLILLSLVLDVLTLPLAVYLQIAQLPPLVGWGGAFVSWILFMLFLRRLALLLDRPGEADEAMAMITRGVALLVGVPLLLVLLYFVAFLSFTQAVALAILVVSVLIVIVQFIFVVLLFLSILGNLQTLRGAITSRLTPSEPEA